MCSISGMLAPKLRPDQRHRIARGLLIAGIDRGRSATGIGFHRNGAPVVVKAAESSYEFVGNQPFADLRNDLPAAVICHTRATTKGTEKNNVNNHPVLSKATGLMLVHNGTVEDEDWRTKDDDGQNPYIYENFDGEVDTEAILRMIETCRLIPRKEDLDIDPEMVANTPKGEWSAKVDLLKAIDDACFNIKGSYACALLDPDDPNTVYLWRGHNSPLYVAYVKELHAVVWASTEKILVEGLKQEKTKLHFNFFPERQIYVPDYYGIDLPEKRLLRVTATEKGFEIMEQDIDPPTYTPRKGTRTSNNQSNNSQSCGV
jgi:glucosamine 6-phosphate synthetase-like amidotransferase/phosphosugar isomerase protein